MKEYELTDFKCGQKYRLCHHKCFNDTIMEVVDINNYQEYIHFKLHKHNKDQQHKYDYWAIKIENINCWLNTRTDWKSFERYYDNKDYEELIKELQWN
jgi:hypothetical protein